MEKDHRLSEVITEEGQARPTTLFFMSPERRVVPVYSEVEMVWLDHSISLNVRSVRKCEGKMSIAISEGRQRRIIRIEKIIIPLGQDAVFKCAMRKFVS